MPADKDRIYLPYNEARRYVLDGDVMMYRGRSLWSKMIKVAGRSRYSHVGISGWSNGDGPDGDYSRLMTYEMLPTGGFGSSLSAHAEKWPRMVDVYRVADSHTTFSWDTALKVQHGETKIFDRRQCVALMKDFCRPGEYGKLHLWIVALQHLPVIRIFARPPTDDAIAHDGKYPFCSEAVAYALRESFTDVVPNTPDRYTEPGDLVRSPLLSYMFTLDAPAGET